MPFDIPSLHNCNAVSILNHNSDIITTAFPSMEPCLSSPDHMHMDHRGGKCPLTEGPGKSVYNVAQESQKLRFYVSFIFMYLLECKLYRSLLQIFSWYFLPIFGKNQLWTQEEKFPSLYTFFSSSNLQGLEICLDSNKAPSAQALVLKAGERERLILQQEPKKQAHLAKTELYFYPRDSILRKCSPVGYTSWIKFLA